MAKGLVLDPTAARKDDIASPGPDAGILSGKRIGFRVDRMWRAWDWVQRNFDALGARTSTFAKPFLLQLGGQFCDPAAQAEVKAFGEAKVREIGAGALEVGRTVESIGLCAALKAVHAAEFEALAAQ